MHMLSTPENPRIGPSWGVSHEVVVDRAAFDIYIYIYVAPRGWEFMDVAYL